MDHSPETWMCGRAEPQAIHEAKESIRQWYDRTTRQWRRGLVWATVAACLFGAAAYALSSFSFLARLQTFNGALTIPIAALIWIMVFVYIFLVPSREASFRNQEWIEAMVTLVEQAVRERVAPAAVVWRRIGDRVERDLPSFVSEFREGVETVRNAAARLDQAVQKNERVAEEAKPVIDALRRIEERIEKEKIIDELKDAARAVKSLGAAPAPMELPRLDAAIAALGGRRP